MFEWVDRDQLPGGIFPMPKRASRVDDNSGPVEFRVAGWPYDRPNYASLAAAVQGEGSRWNVPGLAVGILYDGQVETSSAGFANLATRTPMTDDTISQIGSISKVFTATLAMILANDGVLDLDVPVATYLPELVLTDQSARDTITIRHLLSHTSGIEGDRFIGYGQGDDSLASAIADFGTLRQWFRPGDLWSYSNAGYYLACRVIEVAAGQSFETVFRERLVDPLGLETCFFFAEDVITRPHAVGHYLKSREEGHTMAHGYSFPRHINGTGGVVTSTRELLRFARMHMCNGKIDGVRLLPAKNAKAMREPVVAAGDFHRHYGIGWCVHEYPEFRVISHGGATRGFRANLTAIPDKGFAIAILANGEAGSRAIQEIEAWALETYLNFTRPVPARSTLANKQLKAFAGDYTRHDGRFSVSVVDDRLDLRVISIDEESGDVEDDKTYPILPVGERRFRVPDGPNKGAIVDFIAYDGNGRAESFIRMGGRLAERVSGTTEGGPNAGKAKTGKAKGKKT
jgi:CubicO group peptidase (beta-lactamase class C family)